MQFSNPNKRAPPFPLLKPKLSENKPQSYNVVKDYDDQQYALAPKGGDSSQVRDLKGKIKLIMTKLTTVKKQKEEFQKQNKMLQEEVSGLQTNLRHMVSGFSNTTFSFPTYNEIGSRFAQFYKYECLELFFDVLCSDLNMKGIISFYYYSFDKVDEIITAYFAPCLNSISQTGCFDSIQGPIMNVMRKAFQTTFNQVLLKIQKQGNVEHMLDFIKQKMKMQDLSEENEKRVKQFLRKLLQLRIICFISDPPFEICKKQIGEKVQFNPLLYDPFDGFIKPKDQCWIVLPSVRKYNEDKESATKPLVLQLDYDDFN